MDNKPVVASVVQRGTGEISDDLYPGDTYKIVRANSTESYNKNIKKNFEEDKDHIKWSFNDFSKINNKELKERMKELSQSEKAFLFSILPYISFQDCVLQYSNNKNIGTEDLMEITGLSRGLVYKTVDSLIEKNILHKDKDKKNRKFYVNPWLFSKGNRINVNLKEKFGDYKIKILEDKCWKDLK